MDTNIIIGFSRPTAKFQFFADAIMIVDGSNFAHAYIRFHSDSYDRDLVYQASGLRVNFIGWSLFQSQEVITKEFIIPVSVETKQKVIQFAIDNVGMPYSLGAALGIALVKLASLFGKKIKNPVSQKGYFCSELAAIILQDYCGASLTDDDVKRMTPTDLYNYLLKANS